MMIAETQQKHFFSIGWDALPNNARLWIYQANRFLSDSELEKMQLELEKLMQSWNTHGKKLETGYAVFYNSTIVLAVNEDYQYASGCSIDSSVHMLKKIGIELNVDFFNRMQVLYQLNTTCHLISLNDFIDKIIAGEINKDTLVFDTLAARKSDLPEDVLVSVQQSWHKQFIR
jgi:hypothetical protein